MSTEYFQPTGREGWFIVNPNSNAEDVEVPVTPTSSHDLKDAAKLPGLSAGIRALISLVGEIESSDDFSLERFEEGIETIWVTDRRNEIHLTE